MHAQHLDDPSHTAHPALMQALRKAIPHATPEEWDEKSDAARREFDSLAPRSPAEAQLAAFAVAAMHGAMDNFTRAAQPGISDEKAGRLRGSALAVGRFYKSVMLTLRKPPQQQPAPRPASFAPPPVGAASADASPPGPDPIPAPRFQPMNRAQRRAAAAWMARNRRTNPEPPTDPTAEDPQLPQKAIAV